MWDVIVISNTMSTIGTKYDSCCSWKTSESYKRMSNSYHSLHLVSSQISCCFRLFSYLLYWFCRCAWAPFRLASWKVSDPKKSFAYYFKYRFYKNINKAVYVRTNKFFRSFHNIHHGHSSHIDAKLVCRCCQVTVLKRCPVPDLSCMLFYFSSPNKNELNN